MIAEYTDRLLQGGDNVALALVRDIHRDMPDCGRGPWPGRGLLKATAHYPVGGTVGYHLRKHMYLPVAAWPIALCFDWGYCFSAQSIQEANLPPYIPMERVMCVLVGIVSI